VTPRYTIALDCDGVLFDCDDYIRRLAQRVCPDREITRITGSFEFTEAFGLSKAEMSKLHDLVCDSSATREMEWLDGAREFVDALRAEGHDVFFLTSHWRGAKHWVVQREARLKADWSNCDVVFAHNKARCMFDFLIDDKVENVLSVGAAGVLFDQPWNQHAPSYVRRVKSYDEILVFLSGRVL